MKKIIYLGKRIIFGTIGILPFASIAHAAESKLTDLEGQILKDSAESIDLSSRKFLDPRLQRLRVKIIPALTMKTSLQKAYIRFQQTNPALSGSEIEVRFRETIKILRKNGIIKVKDKEVESSIPSETGL